VRSRLIGIPAWGVIVGVLLALAGCVTAPGPVIDTRYTAQGQDSRVRFLVLHYTAGGFTGSLRTLTEGNVSTHYLVNDNPPKIYQLVSEERRAYHAGVSSWRGTTALNAASIGIEIVNVGYRDSPEGRRYFEFPPEQIDLVIALVKKIVAEHHIKPENVVAHSDIAPGRKPDPGPLFPWKRLADEGLILWPDESRVRAVLPDFERELPDVLWFQDKLAKVGYAINTNGELDGATVDTLAAFQMKYRPKRFDGMPDAETAAMLDVLTTLPATTARLARPAAASTASAPPPIRSMD
jgi:N-acetylmuramoyl-L-alanine amidase